MHEWALAEAVIAAVSETAEKEGLMEISEVKIKVGELQQIELDILNFALSQLKPAKFGNAKFSIRVEKAKLKCRVCGYKWSFQKQKIASSTAEVIHFIPEIVHTYIKCPKCGSPDFEILKGRGIWLQSIKGVKKSNG